MRRLLICGEPQKKSAPGSVLDAGAERSRGGSTQFGNNLGFAPYAMYGFGRVSKVPSIWLARRNFFAAHAFPPKIVLLKACPQAHQGPAVDAGTRPVGRARSDVFLVEQVLHPRQHAEVIGQPVLGAQVHYQRRVGALGRRDAAAAGLGARLVLVVEGQVHGQPVAFQSQAHLADVLGNIGHAVAGGHFAPGVEVALEAVVELGIRRPGPAQLQRYLPAVAELPQYRLRHQLDAAHHRLAGLELVADHAAATGGLGDRAHQVLVVGNEADRLGVEARALVADAELPVGAGFRVRAAAGRGRVEALVHAADQLDAVVERVYRAHAGDPLGQRGLVGARRGAGARRVVTGIVGALQLDAFVTKTGRHAKAAELDVSRDEARLHVGLGDAIGLGAGDAGRGAHHVAVFHAELVPLLETILEILVEAETALERDGRAAQVQLVLAGALQALGGVGAQVVAHAQRVIRAGLALQPAEFLGELVGVLDDGAQADALHVVDAIPAALEAVVVVGQREAPGRGHRLDRPGELARRVVGVQLVDLGGGVKPIGVGRVVFVGEAEVGLLRVLRGAAVLDLQRLVDGGAGRAVEAALDHVVLELVTGLGVVDVVVDGLEAVGLALHRLEQDAEALVAAAADKVRILRVVLAVEEVARRAQLIGDGGGQQVDGAADRARADRDGGRALEHLDRVHATHIGEIIGRRRGIGCRRDQHAVFQHRDAAAAVLAGAADADVRAMTEVI